MTVIDPINLAHWRRQVAEMYGQVRVARPEHYHLACLQFRLTRDQLFRDHSQSPLRPDHRPGFEGLGYYDYLPAGRVLATVDPHAPHDTFTLQLPADGDFRYTRVAYLQFQWQGQPERLSLFWIEGYGGGLFLPFRDGSSGRESYGGGRYLFDTIKGADLGKEHDQLILDFNYAYNPSCAYSDQWVCPLAPPENWLTVTIPAGEKNYRSP